MGLRSNLQADCKNVKEGEGEGLVWYEREKWGMWCSSCQEVLTWYFTTTEHVRQTQNGHPQMDWSCAFPWSLRDWRNEGHKTYQREDQGACFTYLLWLYSYVLVFSYTLWKQYVMQVKHLCQTGAGLEPSEDNITKGHEVHMDFYIPPEGPDEGTEEWAKNLWGGWPFQSSFVHNLISMT